MFEGKKYTVAVIKTIGGLQNRQCFGVAEITFVIIAAIWFGVFDYGTFESIWS